MSERARDILVVVDDDALRTGLSMNLRLEGHEVFTASGEIPAGMVGLSNSFGAALLDADAAGAWGWARELRSHGVPCVGLCRPEARGEWQERLGLADGHILTKPFGLTKLLQAIREAR
jgi:DNA-binding response OmpR family regulator